MTDGEKHFKDLIRYLKRLPGSKYFDMRLWGCRDECGTVCCAVGWHVLRPSVQRRLGIKIAWEPDDDEHYGLDVDYEELQGEDAFILIAQEDFDLEDYEAGDLFATVSATRRTYEEQLEYMENFESENW